MVFPRGGHFCLNLGAILLFSVPLTTFCFLLVFPPIFLKNKSTRRMRYSRLIRMDKLDLMHRTDSKVATYGITLKFLIKVPSF